MKQNVALRFSCCRGFPSIDATRQWASALISRHASLWDAWNLLDDAFAVRSLSYCRGWWPLIDASLAVLSRDDRATIMRIEPKRGTLRIQLQQPTDFQRGVADLALVYSEQKCPGCGRDLAARMDFGEDPLISAVIDAERAEADYDGTSLDVRVAMARLRSRAAVAYWDSNQHTEHAQWLRRAVDELDLMPISQLVWQPDAGFPQPVRGQRCWQVSPYDSGGPAMWLERFLWALSDYAERAPGTWVAIASLRAPNGDVDTGILVVPPRSWQDDLDQMLMNAVAFPEAVSRSVVRKPQEWAIAACVHHGRMWTPFSKEDVLGPWMAWPLQL